jgi:hypothetical protein
MDNKNIEITKLIIILDNLFVFSSEIIYRFKIAKKGNSKLKIKFKKILNLKTNYSDIYRYRE